MENILTIILILAIFFALYFFRDKIFEVVLGENTFNTTNTINAMFEKSSKFQKKKYKIKESKQPITDSEKALFNESDESPNNFRNKNQDNYSINIDELSFSDKPLNDNKKYDTESVSLNSEKSEESGFDGLSNFSEFSKTSNLSDNKSKVSTQSTQSILSDFSDLSNNSKKKTDIDSNFNSIDDIGTFDNISNMSGLSAGSLISRNSEE